MTDDESVALRLAGFALAHAAWSIEDGETLSTLAMVEVDGKRELVRYEADTIAESVDVAHEDLREQLKGWLGRVGIRWVRDAQGRRTD